ncbi:hypothetical protein NBRC116493_02700 [Aurantivibrio infirmus]
MPLNAAGRSWRRAPNLGVKCMRALLLIVAILGLSGCVNSYKQPNTEIVQSFEVQPNQILLALRVKSAKYTDYFPYECDPNNCIPFNFWFIYEAEVLDVISGEFSGKEVVFANLQHTYFIKSVTKEWYVLLEEFTNPQTISTLNTKYYAVQNESPYLWNQQ